MICEKVQIDKKTFVDIENQLNELKATTSDSNSRAIAEKILDIMKHCDEESIITSLKERIEKKMYEIKYKNPELSTSLYILLRNLENGKISREECLDTFEKFMLGEMLDGVQGK